MFDLAAERQRLLVVEAERDEDGGRGQHAADECAGYLACHIVEHDS